METYQIILICICAILAGIFTIVRVRRGGLVAFLFKTLASFALVASAFWAIAYSDIISSERIILSLIGIGLLLGLIGDMLLDLKVVYNNDKIYLNAGMLSFGLGHLCYFSAFSLYAINNNVDLLVPIAISVVCAIAITFAIVMSSKKMKLNFGNYLYQTILYTFVLSFMTIYTLILAIMDGGMWLTFIGMILFFASDVVLSLQYFGEKLDNKWLIAINHILYYSAQIILLTALMIL